MKERAIKICLLVFNTATLFVGLATLIIGILLYSLAILQTALQSVAVNVSGTQISILSILMISIGGLITFISIVGCCGAMNESKCMIGVYCIILFLLFAGQLTVGILGFVYKDTVLEFSARFKSLIDTKDSIATAIEETFNCCGYDGPQDYDSRYNLLVNATTVSLPTEATTPSLFTEIVTGTTTPAATTITTTAATTTIIAATEAKSTMMNDSSTTADGNATGGTNYVTTTAMSGRIVSESCCKRNVTGIIDKQMCLDPSRKDFQQYVKTNGCKDEIIAFISGYELIIGAVSIAFAVLELIALIAGCRLFTTLD